MGHDILDTAPTAPSFPGAWWLAQRYGRGRAIHCAVQWAIPRHSSVADCSAANSHMHRQNPSVTFVAWRAEAGLVDVKLRLRIPVVDDWQVAEVAYCSPRGVCEDDAVPLRG